MDRSELIRWIFTILLSIVFILSTAFAYFPRQLANFVTGIRQYCYNRWGLFSTPLTLRIDRKAYLRYYLALVHGCDGRILDALWVCTEPPPGSSHHEMFFFVHRLRNYAVLAKGWDEIIPTGHMAYDRTQITTCEKNNVKWVAWAERHEMHIDIEPKSGVSHHLRWYDSGIFKHRTSYPAYQHPSAWDTLEDFYEYRNKLHELIDKFS